MLSAGMVAGQHAGQVLSAEMVVGAQCQPHVCAGMVMGNSAGQMSSAGMVAGEQCQPLSSAGTVVQEQNWPDAICWNGVVGVDLHCYKRDNRQRQWLASIPNALSTTRLARERR